MTNNNKLVALIKKYRWYIGAVIIFAVLVYFATANQNSATNQATTSYNVIDTVAKGEVTSGIETTGQIVAAQKLDLDVYKQLKRIDVVNVANGQHVNAGDILVSFDKSSAAVSTESSKVSVAQAALDLQQQQENVTDPNTQIRTTKDQIAGYQKTINDTKQDMENAYRDFLNTDLQAVPLSSMQVQMKDRSAPTISGRYANDTEGQYTIKIYASSADSGYSFQYSGLETGIQSIVSGKAVDLGSRGLKLSFPSDMKSGDTWVIKIPNTDIATYSETKQSYDTKVADLEKTIAGAEVSLQNAQQSLKNLEQTDTSAYRNLDVEKAQLDLQQAQQTLSQSTKSMQELDVIAPFSGTIQDMANVVVGATPVGGTSDSISLGTLVSDTFLTTFDLSAADAAKVQIGQKVKVTITSFVNRPTFDATILEVSSLPSSSGVAQYEVRAQLDYDRASSSVALREGMLADIEVVQQENQNALRIPRAALSYDNGKPTVQVVNSLTDQEKQEVARVGVITTQGTPIATHPVTVELGIQGQYYVEVTSGLSEGDYILTTSESPQIQTTAPAVQAGFGGVRVERFNGGGGGGNRTNSGSNQSGGSNQTQSSGGTSRSNQSTRGG